MNMCDVCLRGGKWRRGSINTPRLRPQPASWPGPGPPSSSLLQIPSIKRHLLYGVNLFILNHPGWSSLHLSECNLYIKSLEISSAPLIASSLLQIVGGKDTCDASIRHCINKPRLWRKGELSILSLSSALNSLYGNPQVSKCRTGDNNMLTVFAATVA